MLSEKQLMAVGHTYGPMLVSAGPGAGKTGVLVERVKRLLRLTEPERIVVITFARKAAEEMRARFEKLTDRETADKVCFGTFHSVFLSWLKAWGVIDRDVRILDEDEKERFLEDKSLGGAEALFSLKRDGKREVREMRELLVKAYEEYKRELHAIDFEDILMLMDRAAEIHHPYLDHDFFLVDEFQDINEIQYRTLKKICAPKGRENTANLFVVGDEDQCIYAFRGSRPELFLNFEKDFPGCQRVDLTVNYRSSGEIVRASSMLIVHNKMRFEKHLVPCERKDRERKKGTVRLLSSFDEREEALSVGRDILRSFPLGKVKRSVCILTRTRSEGVKIAWELKEMGIDVEYDETWDISPTGEKKKRDQVIMTEEVEEILRYLKKEEDWSDPLGEMLPVLYRAGNPELTEKGKNRVKGLLGQDWISALDRQELEEIEKICEEPTVFKVLFHTSYLSQASERMKNRGMTKGDMLRQMARMREKYLKDRDGRKKASSREKVRVMTMHGAKGLEFDRVYVCGLVKDRMPRKEAQDEKGMEEERRLLYVAMTRAKKELILSTYLGLETEASVFVKEVFPDHVSEDK